jgi:Diadenosine tetraphosphate (Ap4A) hydrolase and other HIT family hydrolases
VIPKEVIPRIAESSSFRPEILGHLLQVAAKIAKQLNLKKGFRLVINNGEDGGETVPHLHIHLLGGRKLEWPPG